MSGRWWRAYDEAVDNPKLLLLSDRAHRGWFNLLCVASAYGGTLPAMPIVAIKLRMSQSKVKALIADLVAANLLDETPDGQVVPHDWSDRQYKSDVTDPTAADRMKRYRKRRNGVTANTVTDTVTIPERLRLPETDTESEKKEDIRGRKIQQGRVVLVEGRGH